MKLNKAILIACSIFLPFSMNTLTAQSNFQVKEESLIAQASTESNDGSASESEEATVESVSLINLFKTGGWAMYILLLLSMTAVGVVIYNFIALRPKRFISAEETDVLKALVLEKNYEEAVRMSLKSEIVTTRVIGAGLSRISSPLDLDEVKDAVDEASTEELAKPFVIINLLSIVAALSPMVGLLGTVSGMIKAFRNIAAQGMGQPQVLADNISEALITTATGLLVAIPAMLFYFILKNLYTSIASKVSKSVGDFVFENLHGKS